MSKTKEQRNHKSKLIPALIINAIALAFCIFVLDVKYEVSDDHMIDSVLSGAFNEKGSGSYDTHLLFSNMLLGYPIKLLNMIIPSVSWYFVFLMTLSFASMTTVTYIILSYADDLSQSVNRKGFKKVGQAGIAIAVIFMIYYAADLYSVVQFTKVGAAAAIAGGSFFLFLFWNRNVRFRIPAFIVAIILTMIGVFIRSNVMGVTGPFLMLQFVFYILEGIPSNNSNSHTILKSKQIDSDDEENDDTETAKELSPYHPYIRSCIKRFALCVILVGMALVLNAVGRAIFNRTEEYKKYKEYSSLRASVTDTLKKGYDDVRDALKLVGYDEVDYYMLQSWNFLDRDIYTDDYLDYVATVLKEKSNERTHSLEYVFDQMAKRDYTSYHIFIGLMVIMILTLLIRSGNLTWHIGNIILTFFILGVFFWTGRIVYRIEFGTIFSAAVTALVCGLFPRPQSSAERDLGSAVHVAEQDESATELAVERRENRTELITEPVQISTYHSVSNRRATQICIFAMIIVIITNLFLFIPDTNYKNLTDAEYVSYLNGTLFNSANYASGKYRAVVNSRRPYGNLIDHIEADTEDYYLMDFSSCIQLIYFDYKPWERLPVGYYDENYMYLGGVTMQYPAERELMERHGLDPDNPYKDIVKDGIYVVDNKYYEIKLMYLKKYYYPNARRELVDTIDGYMIWKYYEE